MKISKWNIGDLITLSAAGKKIDANSHLLVKQGTTIGFGMVIGFGSRYARWPVRVQWFGNSLADNCNFKDYELKKFKSDK